MPMRRTLVLAFACAAALGVIAYSVAHADEVTEADVALAQDELEALDQTVDNAESLYADCVSQGLDYGCLGIRQKVEDYTYLRDLQEGELEDLQDQIN
jgi:hypothetical protein